MLGLCAVAGCHWDLNDKSTDPESDQLYFPAGIVMDPNGALAYVSNGNADLAFGGGTVEMIDMLSFECVIAAYRQAVPVDLTNDPKTVLPAACSAHDLAEWVRIGTYDAKCRRDAIDPAIIECDESAFIFQNSTVRVGNFAGGMRLATDPNDAQHRTLFVAVRGDPSIARIDVHLPGSTTGNPLGDFYVPQDLNDPGVLQCVASPETLRNRPEYDPTTGKTLSPAPCDPSFLVQDYYCQYQPNCTVGVNNNGKTQLPTEPFGMAIDNSNPAGRRLVVSHLATGQVSVIAVDKAPANALLSESTEFFPPDSTGRHGAFALAQQVPTDPHSLWYMTSNVNPLIATFRIADAEQVVSVTQQGQFVLSATFNQGSDVRDFAFAPDGLHAYMTENNPPTLVVVDTRPDVQQGGQPRNVVTDVVDICLTPSHMGIRQLDGHTKIAVVCFLSNQLMIVDPDRPGVDATVFSGFAGPNDITFNFTDPGVQPATQQLIPDHHAYVTNYSESTIAVVDLQAGSPTQYQVLAKLGHPLDGFNP